MESEGRGKRPPTPVLVDITPAEVALCFDFAQKCCRLRSYQGKAGWKGGLIAGKMLYGGIDADRATVGIVIGKVGEMAVCKISGVATDLALRDRGDGGKDLPLPSGSVQVKTASGSFATRFVRHPAEACDWFVFATWSGLTRDVRIDGYVSRAALSRVPTVASPRGEWMNKEIHVTDLLPIRQLLKIRPISEVL